MSKQDILIKQAKNLLSDMKTARNDFSKKTFKIVSGADKAAKGLSKIDLDKDLGKVEKNVVKEIDAAVLDFLSK